MNDHLTASLVVYVPYTILYIRMFRIQFRIQYVPYTHQYLIVLLLGSLFFAKLNLFLLLSYYIAFPFVIKVLYVLYSPEVNECPIDLYFVIDTSETIALQESPPGSLVESVTNFTKKFVEKLKDEDYKGKVKITWTVGGLHFSMTQKTISSLTSKDNFINELKRIRYLGKGTFIDCALQKMTENIMVHSADPTSNPKRQRFAVVITDGHVTGNPCEGIKVAAEKARDKGIKIFSIASSNNLEESGLREIANSPVKVYRSNYMAVDLSRGRPEILTEHIDRIYKTMVMSCSVPCFVLYSLYLPFVCQ